MEQPLMVLLQMALPQMVLLLMVQPLMVLLQMALLQMVQLQMAQLQMEQPLMVLLQMALPQMELLQMLPPLRLLQPMLPLPMLPVSQPLVINVFSPSSTMAKNSLSAPLKVVMPHGAPLSQKMAVTMLRATMETVMHPAPMALPPLLHPAFQLPVINVCSPSSTAVPFMFPAPTLEAIQFLGAQLKLMRMIIIFRVTTWTVLTPVPLNQN